MKTFFKILVGIILLALVGGIVFFIVKDFVPALGGYTTTIHTYVMDPDTSKYTETTKKVNVKKNSSYNIEKEEKQYYIINLDKSVLDATNITSDIELSIYYDCVKVNVTFNANGGTIDGDSTYTVNAGSTFKAPTITKDHYTLVGFENYVKTIYSDSTFTALWEETKYKVTLVLPEGATINNDRFTPIYGTTNYECSISYFETLTIPFVTSTLYTFEYFKDEFNNHYTKLQNIESDLVLQGVFFETMYTITYNIDSLSISPTISPSGKNIDAPYINPTQMIPGSSVNWYTDSSYTTLYDFRYMPSNNIELFGRWEDDTKTGFLNYEISKSTIDNLDEFVWCIDYTYFNYLTESNKLTKKITYVSESEISGEFSKAANMSEYRSNVSIQISWDNEKNVSLYLENNHSTIEATRSEEANSHYTLPFLGYTTLTNQRSSDYDSFYIEKLTNTYNVSTTNQLMYVVEHGYKPICEGKALTIYNKAKDVLRNIINDDMSDYEKLEAIFLYLTTNIQYDFVAKEKSDDGGYDWFYYDAYFLEGVFNNKKAVCDGISKALALLCNMEGIKCVEVSGNNHAWCKVKIKNRWYCIDATMGNLGITGDNATVVDYGEFLISEATKASRGYTSKEYPLISASQDFNPLEYKKFTIGFNTYNYVVDDENDFARILQYATSESHAVISLDLYLTSTTSFTTLFNNACNKYFLYTGKTFNKTIKWLPSIVGQYTTVKLIIE